MSTYNDQGGRNMNPEEKGRAAGKNESATSTQSGTKDHNVSTDAKQEGNTGQSKRQSE
ncbi:hypothetical protein KBD61_03725 [Patescibacteria group bacterium]|nr:hypothetical protein [Patescibacteria group bacterium]MBP9710106.1 hypothetical protein [Patescibacteria group bacterium]